MAEEQLFLILKEIAVLVAALGGGRLAVPIVSFLKRTFHTQGGWTILIAIIVSGLLGALGLVAEGLLLPGQIALENISVWGLAIFVASQAIYRQLVDQGILVTQVIVEQPQQVVIEDTNET